MSVIPLSVTLERSLETSSKARDIVSSALQAVASGVSAPRATEFLDRYGSSGAKTAEERAATAAMVEVMAKNAAPHAEQTLRAWQLQARNAKPWNDAGALIEYITSRPALLSQLQRATYFDPKPAVTLKMAEILETRGRAVIFRVWMGAPPGYSIGSPNLDTVIRVTVTPPVGRGQPKINVEG